MQYNVIGLMSGSSLDGLDIAFVHFEETAGIWTFEILETTCKSYSPEWIRNLSSLTELSAREYLLMHAAYGHWLGETVNEFLLEKDLSYRVQLIASHGHTSFHIPALRMTAQLGDGAAIAAVTGIRTISDLRSVDIALGGQGAPVVPIGEKLLFPEYDLFLNIGGIANISSKSQGIATTSFAGFDVCPANSLLNLLAGDTPKGYDENGDLARTGTVDEQLLAKLNGFEYYGKSFPKSLSNDFGLKELYPVITAFGLSKQDALRTYVAHIAGQIATSVKKLRNPDAGDEHLRLLITGGGAHNLFLTEQLQISLASQPVELLIPSKNLIDYKEALIIALMGVLRWREDINVMHTVTGASKDSINGAVWSV